MTGIATIICLVLGLSIAVVAGVRALLDRPSSRAEIGAAAVTELAVLFYVGLRVADLIGGHHTSGAVIVVVAYLAALVLAMPITAALAWAETSRWSSVVLGSGALVTCVLFARINQLWTRHG
jgi:hypothetical protein